jgi:hypothetical protein
MLRKSRENNNKTLKIIVDKTCWVWYNRDIMKREGKNMKNKIKSVKVVKDDFFATKKWFIVTDTGFKMNVVGWKTKKAAVAAVEATGWTVKEG